MPQLWQLLHKSHFDEWKFERNQLLFNRPVIKVKAIKHLDALKSLISLMTESSLRVHIGKG